MRQAANRMIYTMTPLLKDSPSVLTRHDAVEYGCYQYARSEQCQQGASGIGVGYFLVVVYQYDGGQAEQVQQVHADTQTGQVGNENQPAVTVRLVGNVLPFQYEPEYDGSEQ